MTDRTVLLCTALIAAIVIGAASVTGPWLERMLAMSDHEPRPKREVICEATPSRVFLDELEEMHAAGWTTSRGTVQRVTRHEPHEPFPCSVDDPAWPK